jgi:hypothetical protein
MIEACMLPRHRIEPREDAARARLRL